MPPPRIWGADELNDGRTGSDIRDGDLKIYWVNGLVQIAVRVAGTWRTDYLVRTGQVGSAGGIAPLGTDGKVPSAQLPTTLAATTYGSAPGTACEGSDARLSDARLPIAHTHAESDVTALVTDLAAKAPTIHSHAIGDVALLQATLNGKALVAHTHAEADVTGLATDLAARQLTSQKGLANGYAGLDATGKVPWAQLPAGWTAVMKLADTVRTNTVALAADPDLQVALAANTRYLLRGRLAFDTGATADFKWRHMGPGSPALVRLARRWIVPSAIALAGVAVDTAFSAADLALIGTGTTGGWIEIEGIVLTGTTAGTFAIAWAQNKADSASTIVLAGSYLEWRQA